VCRLGAFEKAPSCRVFTPEWDSILQHTDQSSFIVAMPNAEVNTNHKLRKYAKIFGARDID
jgi:hypothetical protein